MARRPLISIIIPVCNEETEIRDAIEACLALRPQPEVIVCDGWSSDRTVAIATDLGVPVIRSARRGRSFQMNEGAAAASGETFVFLHADTRIDQGAWEALISALEDAAVLFGAFRRRFVPGSWLLGAGSWLAAWRGRVFKIFLGDQAIFVRAGLFRESGGYREILLFEDIDLCLRLRRKGKGIIVDAPVVTSGRRFQAEGNATRLYRNVVLWMKYWAGADPNELAHVYYPGYYTTLPHGNR